MATTEYGDIGNNAAAFAKAAFLSRAVPAMCLSRLAQPAKVPKNSTNAVKFRRYNALPLATTPLTEAVTPSATSLTVTDVTTTLAQYGDVMQFSDVIADTHEDPVLQMAMEVAGEQAGQTLETLLFNIIKAGTMVSYANGVARNAVNTPLTKALQQKATRHLKRQNGKTINRAMKSTAMWGSEAIQAGYFAIIHPDVENAVRAMSGFVAVADYGQVTPFENELGAVDDVRYLSSTLYSAFADAGGAAGGTYVSTGGTNCDVYPVIYIAKDAFASVVLRGHEAVTPTVVNAKPSDSDPLAQRSKVGWKTYFAAAILNDNWLHRVEVAAAV